jgi:serine/threonine-protein kinase
MTGLHFGRYQILERLSAGGMGTVYRGAAHGVDGFKKPVVIKRVHGHLARDPAITARFVNEAKLTMAMSHGNLVQVLDLGKLEDEYFIVLEYVDGRDLRTVLGRAWEVGDWPSLALALHVVAQVLHGLSYAHRRTDEAGASLGIVHRDVKPANILCSYEGEVKLTDFGVAKALASHLTQEGAILGSLRYMSPEQAKGDAVDQRSDIFSAGAVLYTLLCRAQPFPGDDFDAVVRAVINARFLPPDAHGVTVPPELQRILLTALARDPARRYATAAAMLADLERHQRTHGSLATSSDLRELMRRLFLEDAVETRPLPEDGDTLVNAELEVEPTSHTQLGIGPVSSFVLSHPSEPRGGGGASHAPSEETQPATPRAMSASGGILDDDGRPGEAEASFVARAPVGPPAERSAPQEVRAERSATRATLGTPGPDDPSDLHGATSRTWVPRDRWVFVLAAVTVLAVGAAVVFLVLRSTHQPLGADRPDQHQRDAAGSIAGSQPVLAAPDVGRARPHDAGQPLAGQIRVVSVPAGAAVTLDDRPVGRTPLTVDARLGSPHRVGLQLRGFRAWQDSVVLSSESPRSTLDVTLVPAGRSPVKPQAKGWVQVSTQPAYAEVFLGEQRLDVTPCRIQLPVGAHVLRLVNRKLGRVVKRRVVVRADREARVVLEDFE